MIFIFVAIQCDNGHIVCSTCCPKLRNKCNKCSLSISSKGCTAIENLLQSIKISCPNAKLGCIEKISYSRKRKHEEECIYEQCVLIKAYRSIYGYTTYIPYNVKIKEFAYLYYSNSEFHIPCLYLFYKVLYYLNFVRDWHKICSYLWMLQQICQF
jgi:hypothetical protein